MWTWLDKNTNALQGLGAVITALAALAALIIIPLQINAAEKIQRRQAARDLYRGLIAMTIERPALATADYCTIAGADAVTAYTSFVELMLYTGEQVMAVHPEDWRDPLMAMLADHRNYFCASDDWAGHDAAIQQIIYDLRASCPAPALCTSGAP